MGRKCSRRWNSCLMWFATSLGALCLTISCSSASNRDKLHDDREEVMFSSGSTDLRSQHVVDNNRKLIYVSTLDGKFSALDVKNEGELLWSVPADDRPLLSSSISKLEIMENGVSTRYIPSLDGGLYRYDGESINPVPLIVDKLLSSTHKMSEDTMMVGGKDLVTFGLNPQTGEVRYRCGVKGCRTFGDDVDRDDDLLIVTRHTQAVRAVDSRTGSEKWNYSVGQHEVAFMKGHHKVIDNHGDKTDQDEVTCSIDNEDMADTMDMFCGTVKIVVPDGMVVGVSPDNCQSVAWTYKFKSPISSVWLLYQGELRQLDLFDNKNIPALSSFNADEAPIHQPLLYVGMHDKQFYVQSSDRMREKMMAASEKFKDESILNTCNTDSSIPRVSWKPYLNTAQWRTPTMRNKPAQIAGGPPGHLSTEQCDQADDHALVIWHENYPFDNGFYLYPEFTVKVPLSEVEDMSDAVRDGNQSHESTLYEGVLAMPVTLWTWWKEVIAISVLFSVLTHLIVNRLQKVRKGRQIAQNSGSSQPVSETSSPKEDVENDSEGAATPPSRQNSDQLESRYTADYDHIHVLGKGGFGVVFEARNKVDECHYAIKRIPLPNSDGAKEKVMREVKTLAKLDHVGIVRYFHTWIESPPAGWQEEKDREFECSEGVTSPVYSEYTSHSPSPIAKGSPPKLTESSNKSINNSQKLQPSPLDFLKNALGNNFLEFSESQIKRGSSEEFSVHNVSESGWAIDELSTNNRSGGLWGNSKDIEKDESGSFSGMGTPNLNQGHLDDSIDISFRHYDNDNISSNNNVNSLKTTGKLGWDTHDIKQGEHIVPIEDSNSAFQIVFEDSGCGDRSSKDSCEDASVSCHSNHSRNFLDSCSLGSNIDTTNPFKKTHSRSNSQLSVKSHSRSPSWDLANLAVEKETNHKDTHDSDKKITTQESSKSTPKPKLYLYIQMQLCRKDTLKDWLSANTLNRDRHTVLDIFDQIVSAIEYVHDSGLMHRDLKPSNIFFSLDGVVKMGDFGLVTALSDEQSEVLLAGDPFKKHTAQVGTQLYMSPEQMSGKKYSAKVDIFSLGVILFELLYPFATQMERVNTLVNVKQQILPERFNREMQREAKFVSWLLSPKPEDRPSAKAILESDLLKEFESRRMPRRFRSRTVSQNSS